MKSKASNLYIDLFSGCGGLSLGLGNAGWNGLFAIEKDPMAFETFKHNLLEGSEGHFQWPDWLPIKETSIQNVLKKYKKELSALKGNVDLIAGGPPCQGFSLAGQRNPNDPRNQLSRQYIQIVDLVRPKFLILENVRGFNAKFANAKGRKGKFSQAEIVSEELKKLGYNIFSGLIDSQWFGVPQTRQRYVLIGIHTDVSSDSINLDPFQLLYDMRKPFLKKKKLPLKPITVKEAISDLEITDKKLIHHSGSVDKGFKKIDYIAPAKLSAYQRLMRKGLNGLKPNSLRLPRHKVTTVNKFIRIKEVGRAGITLNAKERELIGTKKQAITVLDPCKPSRTLTTLPDDIIHYCEPRILTVRESARLQSFPDDFKFKGKYTTGGNRRVKECPRYTQVGNAVPPLLGEALGLLILQIGN